MPLPQNFNPKLRSVLGEEVTLVRAVVHKKPYKYNYCTVKLNYCLLCTGTHTVGERKDFCSVLVLVRTVASATPATGTPDLLSALAVVVLYRSGARCFPIMH